MIIWQFAPYRTSSIVISHSVIIVYSNEVKVAQCQYNHSLYRHGTRQVKSS